MMLLCFGAFPAIFSDLHIICKPLLTAVTIGWLLIIHHHHFVCDPLLFATILL